MKKIATILILSAVVLFAQVRIIDTQVLEIENNAIQPVFSADGNYILYGSNDGLYSYQLKEKKATRFAESGYDPVMDTEGMIRYRFDNYNKGYRLTSFLVYDSKTKKTEFVLNNLRLESSPKITNHGVFYIEKDAIKNNFAKATQTSKPVAFTLNNKVVLYSYGTSKILTPAGDHPHLWPSVSPSQDKLCVVGGNDLYICDLNGNILSEIKNARAPQWSPDGKWIAFMRDEDDGNTFTASDIYLVNADGSNLIRLTDSMDRIEMYPQWSPNGKQIICDNPVDGKPILITFEIK